MDRRVTREDVQTLTCVHECFQYRFIDLSGQHIADHDRTVNNNNTSRRQDDDDRRGSISNSPIVLHDVSLSTAESHDSCDLRNELSCQQHNTTHYKTVKTVNDVI